MESGLLASLDEADFVAVAGAETSAEAEASSNHETPKEPNAPSSCVADPEGVSVSMCSLSNREVVTMPNTTFLGVALVARAARS